MRRTSISSGSTCIPKARCISTTKIRFLAAGLDVDLQGQIPHQGYVFPYVDTFSIHIFSNLSSDSLSEHIRIPSWCHDDIDNTDKFRADSNGHCVNLDLYTLEKLVCCHSTVPHVEFTSERVCLTSIMMLCILQQICRTLTGCHSSVIQSLRAHHITMIVVQCRKTSDVR